MMVSVLGISFHTAPVELREQASVRPGQIPATLQRIRAEFPAAELVLLSTCNRTELYVAGVDVALQKDALLQVLLTRDANAHVAGLEQFFYIKHDLQAVEHLFAVAASLDAMVVGETEILGQVKQALVLAEEAGTTGKVLHPLFQHAFKTAKRVHTETDICRGRVSVSSLAVEFAEKIFEDLSSKTVMIVGAGEMAELALKSLMDRGARDVLVLNRSLERGQNLADRCGGRALQFELLDDYLAKADIVISSTSAPHIVIQADSIRRASEVRRGRPILLIDIAVPRDIDPAASVIKNVYVYTIDDLERVAAENLAKRQDAVEQAWHLVRQGTSEVAMLFESSGLRVLLRRFDEHGKAICETALQRALAKEKLAALPEPSREEIRVLAQKIVNKMLAEPREALKRAAHNGEWELYARVVNDLFGFEKDGDGKDKSGTDRKKL
ncbi:MAG: glutamyl-tRNA reductase [bacterium]